MSYASLLKSNPGGSQTFRLARIGPGWIAGTLEAVSGMRRPGDHVAVTYCRLHHLPFSKIQEVEKSNPSLALSLYKLLSYLMARRQEATIGQLATLHSIMTSPATSVGPLRRVSSQL
jgi:CRP-like cAMP-binding protein